MTLDDAPDLSRLEKQIDGSASSLSQTHTKTSLEACQKCSECFLFSLLVAFELTWIIVRLNRAARLQFFEDS